MILLRLGKLSSRDARNLVWLMLNQIANATFPLIVAPYLLYTVGAGEYAQFAIAEAVAMGLLTFAMYSFDLDAIASVVGKDVRAESDAISRAFSEVLYARLLLFLGAGSITVVVVAVLDSLLLEVLWGWGLFVLSQVLVSAWLYQGIERNWIPAWFTIGGRLCALAGILILVRPGTGAATASIIVGIASIVFSMALVIFAARVLGIRLTVVPFTAVMRRLKDGWTVFLGGASVFLYRDANLIVLGTTVSDPVSIAMYSLSEKAVKCLQAAARPVNQLFLPKAVSALRNFDRANRRALRRLVSHLRPQLLLVGLGLLACGIALMAVLHLWPEWARAKGLYAAVPLVLVMSPSVLLGVANFMLGSVGLNNLGASRYLFASIASIGLMNVVCCAVLSLILGVMGAAISFMLSEFGLLALVLRSYLQRGRACLPRSP